MRRLLISLTAAAQAAWKREPVVISGTIAAAIVALLLRVGLKVDVTTVQTAVVSVIPFLLALAGRRVVTPAASVGAVRRAVKSTAWIPEGRHYGLQIKHIPSRFPSLTWTAGRPKLCWHTTESPMTTTVETMAGILENEGFPVHFTINPVTGHVAQLLPLTGGGYGLRHAGGPPTNTAHVIQVEIIGRAADTASWTENELKHLAALAALIDHRVHVGTNIVHPFAGSASKRIAPSRFAAVTGHIGHCHVPENDHVDPGHLNVPRIVELQGSFR